MVHVCGGGGECDGGGQVSVEGMTVCVVGVRGRRVRGRRVRRVRGRRVQRESKSRG